MLLDVGSHYTQLLLLFMQPHLILDLPLKRQNLGLPW